MAEMQALIDIVNRRLVDDDKVKDLLPIQNEDDFFKKAASGMLLVKFLELFLDINESSKLNVGKLNNWQMQANVRATAAAFKAARLRSVVSESDVSGGNREPITKALWEAVDLSLIDNYLKKAYKDTANFEKLLEEGETGFKLNRKGPGELLKRWINYQLVWMEKEEWFIQEGDLGRVEGITDLKDGFHMYWFIRQLFRNQVVGKDFEEKVKGEGDAVARIGLVFEALKAHNPHMVDFVTPQVIADGNEKLMTCWLIELFRLHNGLEDITYFDKHYLQDIADYSGLGKAGEESQIKLWMISLGYSSDFDTLKDGLVLLKLLDAIQPGCVDWKTVATKPKHKFDMVANCDKAIQISKDVLKLKLVGISGSNLHSADPAMITKFLSGVFKAHMDYVLLAAGGGSQRIGENFLIQWGNSRVEDVEEIADLKDAKFADGKYLCAVMTAIYPRYIDPAKISDDPVANFNLALHCAIKLGCPVFATPKECQENQYKLLHPTFASLYMKDVKMNPWLYDENYLYARGN